MQQVFCDQEQQIGTGKDKSRSARNLKHKNVGLCPFLLIKFLSHFALAFYSFTATNLSFSNRMMTAILNILMLSDQEDGYLKTMNFSSLTAKR